MRKGGVGVIPTDTVYGIVGSALKRKTVERIYRLRRRNTGKPMIVLISSVFDVRMFGVELDHRTLNILNDVWPGKASVVLPCPSRRFAYLHRGTKTLAIRMPADAALRRFLRRTGPLVAPSANIQGQPPSKTIAAARGYFGDTVDFYVDGGKRAGRPSTLVRLAKEGIKVLRPGAWQPPARLTG